MSNKKTTTAYFTTAGSVRGGCGHKHRTLESAERCLCADARGCRKVGGYSDRSVYAIGHDGTETRYLTFFEFGRALIGESTPDAGAWAFA